MSLATWLVYILSAQVGLLVIVDIILAASGRQTITVAIRAENASTGWLVAGAFVVLGLHLFVVPYAILAWRKAVG